VLRQTRDWWWNPRQINLKHAYPERQSALALDVVHKHDLLLLMNDVVNDGLPVLSLSLSESVRPTTYDVWGAAARHSDPGGYCLMILSTTCMQVLCSFLCCFRN
jgi:hypothetical protein